jgi:hypothetical protein
MPRKPEPPIEIEHAYNPDVEAGREAYIRTLEHLIDFILVNDVFDEPANVDTRNVA